MGVLDIRGDWDPSRRDFFALIFWFSRGSDGVVILFLIF